MPGHNPNFSVRSPATMIIDWPSLSGIFVTGSDVDVYLVQELHNSKSWIWRCFVLACSGILFFFLWGGGQGKGRLGERGMEKGEMGREKGERGRKERRGGWKEKRGEETGERFPLSAPSSLFIQSFFLIYLFVGIKYYMVCCMKTGGGLYLCEKISTFELTVFWFLSISDHLHIWMNARASHVTSIYIIMDLVYLFHLQGGCRLVNITYTDIVHNGYKNVTRRDVVTYMYLF